MRVLVERGSIPEGMLTRVLRETPDATVLVLSRDEIERELREGDVVITRVVDLPAIGARDKPVAVYGELRISPTCATYKEDLLEELRRVELALLYELASAGGKRVTRVELHERCWLGKKKPKLRTVDVVVSRLRRKIERATGLQIVADRDLGYRLVLPPEPVRPRVLVVEDERLMQSAYERLFLQYGIEADFADSAAMGKLMAERRDYAAYFIDLNMPGGSGAAVIPVIQKRAPLAPIMIVTARSDDEAIGLSGKYGVAYVEKPFNPQDLHRFVKRAVGLETG